MRFLGLLLMCVCSQTNAEMHFDAWARATPPGGGSGAIYGVVSNSDDQQREVTGILQPLANHVMVHRTIEEDGMQRMRHARLIVPAAGILRLQPGGLHIMLMGLKVPLVEGCHYPLTLVWDNGAPTEHEFLTGTYSQSVPPGEEVVGCP